MAKIPNALREPIGTAFPANVVLVGTIMPDGYVQISPRGSTLVFDDETIAFWDRGSGHTHDNMKDGDKVTLFFRDPELRASGVLPAGGVARFYGTVTIHADGPTRDAVWDRMIEPEKNAAADKKGRAVLVAIERAEDLKHNPLEL